MRPGHFVDTCLFGPCRKCDKKHNTLICDTLNKETGVSRAAALFTINERSDAPAVCAGNDNMHTHINTLQVNSHADTQYALLSREQPVLLSTAIVEVLSQSGVYYKARAVLDSGSERSFITQSFCDKLNTPLIQSTQQIRGIGSSIIQCSRSCFIELKSLNSNYATRIQCLVLPNITSKIPNFVINLNNFNIPSDITLADQKFFENQPIDLLIGADLF
jgi:hypothetical protein